MVRSPENEPLRSTAGEHQATEIDHYYSPGVDRQRAESVISRPDQSAEKLGEPDETEDGWKRAETTYKISYTVSITTIGDDGHPRTTTMVSTTGNIEKIPLPRDVAAVSVTAVGEYHIPHPDNPQETFCSVRKNGETRHCIISSGLADYDTARDAHGLRSEFEDAFPHGRFHRTPNGKVYYHWVGSGHSAEVISSNNVTFEDET